MDTTLIGGGARDNRGAVAVIMAAAIVMLIAFAGLAIDTAYVRRANQELQHAASAAALAGAQMLEADAGDPDYTITRQTARDCAAANVAASEAVLLDVNTTNSPTGDIVVGQWDRFSQSFTPTLSSPNAVRVTAARTDTSLGGAVSLFFGGGFKVSTSQISRSAVAHMGGGAADAVIILDPDDYQAFDQRGNAELYVPFNGITVDSNDGCAFYMNGAPNVPRVIAGHVNVVGGACMPIGSVTPDPYEGADYVPDPYAGIPEPTTLGMTTYGSMNTTQTYLPGYYPNGCDMTDGFATLTSGVYYFGPPGINLNGDGIIQGEEVMLFIADGGSIRIAGNSPGFDISPPTSGPYEGICIFFERSNTADCSISGGGLFDVKGAMYMASSHLEMDGNVDRQVGRIVVNTLQFRGNGRYTITGRGILDQLLYPILVD